jgi:hypothetical protein
MLPTVGKEGLAASADTAYEDASTIVAGATSEGLNENEGSRGVDSSVAEVGVNAGYASAMVANVGAGYASAATATAAASAVGTTAFANAADDANSAAGTRDAMVGEAASTGFASADAGYAAPAVTG